MARLRGDGVVSAVAGRPDFATDAMVAFLDAVQEQTPGSTDRVVRPKLEAAFGMDSCRAAMVVTWWRKEFAGRHDGASAY